jgi:NADPH-dependent 2,4-dienoyl-CoA reductase/sulfur reductase-like enzyme/rhodanese-related sulfurtransferase
LVKRIQNPNAAFWLSQGVKKRVIIVGGVAGGASAAARLRRLDENAEIVILERGAFVSFANCGLPYRVGDVITDERKLLVATPELLRDRFRIEVHTEHEVTAIDRAARTVTVRNLSDGSERKETYDALLLSPGAGPIRPPIPGIDLPGVFTVRSIPDVRQIRAWIDKHAAKRAVIVGGGFIGLEMAENLRHRGLDVTIVEKLDQLMPPLDPEMAVPVRLHCEAHGVTVRLGDGLASLTAAANGGLTVRTDHNLEIAADLVILAIGVRPEIQLAKAAALTTGPRGGIVVDSHMRTSDPAIWAVGDAVEISDVVTASAALVPLAGPANRQARIAAASITGRSTGFRGVQGTAVCGVLGLTIASTGASEKSLRRAGLPDFQAVYLHPGHHVGYYPGAKPIHLKLLFRPSDGRVLGAQAVGEAGVERRIDTIAMAIQMRATVDDLAEAELCYAPQYGAAKDPVNLAGMIAQNARNQDSPLAGWSEIDGADVLILDVRESFEWHAGHFERAVHIPLGQLRDRLGELPKDRPILVHCAVGLRAHIAVRILRQRGFDARNLSGGWTTWRHVEAAAESARAYLPEPRAVPPEPTG